MRARPGARFNWVTAAGLTVIVSSLALTATLLWMANHKSPAYSQDSPEDLIRSAVAMVKNGEARRLSTLFYAESPEMRAVLQRLGGLLGSLQKLGGAVGRRFPQDVARLREEAVTKATTAASNASVLSALTTRRRGGAGGAGGAGNPPGGAPRDEQAMQDLAMTVFADPFGWIERNAERLSAVSVSDDQAAVMLDGKPVPPVGVLLRRAEGRWQIELPTSLPGVSQYMPQTRAEYSMIGSLVKVVDNLVKDLTEDVETGRIGRVNQLAEKAGEKAIVPIAMVAIAYGKEMDVRNRRERAMADYRKRQATWLEERATLQESLGDDTVRKLKDTLDRLAVEELDKLVRADSLRASRQAPRSVPNFGEMPTPAFEMTLEGWLAAAGSGGKVRLAEAPSKADVEQAVAAVEAAGRKQLAGKGRR